MKGEAAIRGFAKFWSESYFPALDGIRAICVAAVIYYHLHEPRPAWIHGNLGVDVFFVLSGFLITTLLLREKEKYGAISLKGFYVRRTFRILPIYFFVLLLYVFTIHLTHDAARWREFKIGLPYFLTFTQEFRPLAAGNVYGQTWSLGYEEKFYLAWPLLVILLYPFRRKKILLLLALGVVPMFLHEEMRRSYGGLFLGALLGVVLDRSSHNRFLPYIYNIRTWFAGLLVAVAYTLYVLKRADILCFSAAITLLVATLVLRDGLLRKVFEQRWMVLLGKRSYAMYLVHALVLNAAGAAARKAHLDTWYVVLTLTYLGSFVVATILYYLVEKPCIEQGRRISRRIRERMSVSQPMPVRNLKVEPIENVLEG